MKNGVGLADTHRYYQRKANQTMHSRQFRLSLHRTAENTCGGLCRHVQNVLSITWQRIRLYATTERLTTYKEPDSLTNSRLVSLRFSASTPNAKYSVRIITRWTTRLRPQDIWASCSLERILTGVSISGRAYLVSSLMGRVQTRF